MKIVTGDESGLLKVTTIKQQAIVPMPNKKLKSSICRGKSTPSSIDSDAEVKKDEIPLVKTRVFGTVDRSRSIQFLAQSTLDPNVVVIARVSGIIECVSIETGSILKRHTCFHPALDASKQNEQAPRLSIAKIRKRPEHFIGLHEHNGTIIACTNTGKIFYLQHKDDEVQNKELPHATASLGMDCLSKMRVHPHFPHIFATGGEERDLCVWDINSLFKPAEMNSEDHDKTGCSIPEKKLKKKRQENAETQPPIDPNECENNTLPVLEPIWMAKNVKHDFLDMRAPVWITEIQWIGKDSPTRLVTGTGHHQVRIYDTKLQRRPILDVNVGEHPIKNIAIGSDELDIICADTTGQMTVIHGKSGVVSGKFLGIAGAVTQVVCCVDNDTVVTIGIDRKLRLFERSGKRRITKEVYLKQRLTAMVVDEYFRDETETSNETNDGEKLEQRNGNKSMDESDILWESIPIVDDDTPAKKESVSLTRSSQTKRKQHA
ncbi:Ribosome biogenesis protein nsa1 (NOP7-associated protein 1) [Batrachochytrium dendrobatidis]|nr:Ribosome biogenesis protein nsa1 (NOP7-associated protein 1) [Batrachochytrium dendrobatidis]